MQKSSIGILTSGGDAPGMNAAIRAVFRNIKMQEPEREIIFFRDGYRGLAGRLDTRTDRNVDRSAVRDILHRGGTFLGTGRVPQLKSPSQDAPDYEERLAEQQAFLKVAAANVYQLGIHDLIVIGGDGSYKGATVIAEHFRESFHAWPFRVIGLPGTIDNDIYGCDPSIGYDTALNNVVDSIRKLRDTIESHQRAIILEVMGNHSGWLALESAIAGGASVVCIPEVADSFDQDRIIRCLRAGVRRKYRYFIIVVAEGVMRKAGADWMQRLKERIETDPEIYDTDGEPMDARINSVGHVARGGQPTARENTNASLMSRAASEAILNGTVLGNAIPEGDIAIGMDGLVPRAIPLAEVVDNSPKLVTESSELYRLAQQLMLQPHQPF